MKDWLDIILKWVLIIGVLALVGATIQTAYSNYQIAVFLYHGCAR